MDESEPIHLLVEHYLDSSPERQAELDRCLHLNLENLQVARVWLFGLQAHLERVAGHPRLTKVPVEKRMMFRKFFEFASEKLPGRICTLANSDIYFDETMSILRQLDYSKRMAWLTRWDVQADGTSKFLEQCDSADSWTFRAPFMVKHCDFHLGVPGCDNRMAYLANQAGFTPVNPGRTIKSHHLHLTSKRNYGDRNRIPGPYLCVLPTHIENLDLAPRPFNPALANYMMLAHPRI